MKVCETFGWKPSYSVLQICIWDLLLTLHFMTVLDYMAGQWTMFGV